MYNVYLNNVKHGETNEKQYLVPNLETGREHEFRVHDGVNEDSVKILVPMPGQDITYEIIYEKDGTGRIDLHTLHLQEQHPHQIIFDGELAATTDWDSLPIPFYFPLTEHELEIRCVRQINDGSLIREPVKGLFTTPAFDTSIVPTLSRVDILSPNEYIIVWDDSTYKKGYYEGVELEISVNDGSWVRIKFHDGIPREYKINALTAEGATNVKLRYYCPAINQYSDSISKDLYTTTNQEITGLTSTDLYFDGSRITWNPLDATVVGKTLRYYDVIMQTQPERSISTTGTQWDVRGVDVNLSEHLVRVFARYTDGSYSKTAHYQSPKRIAPELDVIVHEVTYDSVTVGLNLGAPFRGDVVNITVDGVTKPYYSSSGKVVFTGLKSDTSYNVNVHYRCDYMNADKVFSFDKTIKTAAYPAIQLQLVEPTFTGAKIRWNIPEYNTKVVKYNIYNNGVFVGETKGNIFELKSGIFNPSISLTMNYETTDGKISASSNPLVVTPLPVNQLRLTVDPTDITNNSVKVGSSVRMLASDVVSVKLETLDSQMLASDSITHDIQKVQFINLASGTKYRLQGYLVTNFGTPQELGFSIPSLTFTTV
ncbi:baseplate wedge intiator [Lysinibacillus phage vB_LspM-01]|nr:baseplate wedge intiator [Lysinibacillus phage vB_LspM-01]